MPRPAPGRRARRAADFEIERSRRRGSPKGHWGSPYFQVPAAECEVSSRSSQFRNSMGETTPAWAERAVAA
eukprot:3708530-Prymnesium_polylepis.1